MKPSHSTHKVENFTCSVSIMKGYLIMRKCWILCCNYFSQEKLISLEWVNVFSAITCIAFPFSCQFYLSISISNMQNESNSFDVLSNISGPILPETGLKGEMRYDYSPIFVFVYCILVISIAVLIAIIVNCWKIFFCLENIVLCKTCCMNSECHAEVENTSMYLHSPIHGRKCKQMSDLNQV